MKGSEIFLIIVVGVATTIIGNIIWNRMTSRGPAAVLPFPTKTADCGCKG